MVETLIRGPATVNELAAQLPIARPGVSRHLRVLREAGLVGVRQEAQRRVHSLRLEPPAEVDEWLSQSRACPSTGSPATGPDGRSTWRTSAPTSPGGSPATSRRGGTSSCRPTRTG